MFGARAYAKKDFEKALQAYRKICNDYPRSAFCRRAQFNIGTVLQRQQKYDDAVLEYRKLVPSKGSGHDPGGETTPPFMDYRRPAAKRIAICYEQKKDFSKALEWVEAARNKHPERIQRETWEAAEAEHLACWKARLLDNLGRDDEALKLVEPMVSDADWESETATFLVVDTRWDVRSDLFYALVLLDSRESKAVVDSYVDRPQPWGMDRAPETAQRVVGALEAAREAAENLELAGSGVP